VREKYGNHTKERVGREFTRELMVERVLEVYQEMKNKAL